MLSTSRRQDRGPRSPRPRCNRAAGWAIRCRAAGLRQRAVVKHPNWTVLGALVQPPPRQSTFARGSTAGGEDERKCRGRPGAGTGRATAVRGAAATALTVRVATLGRAVDQLQGPAGHPSGRPANGTCAGTDRVKAPCRCAAGPWDGSGPGQSVATIPGGRRHAGPVKIDNYGRATNGHPCPSAPICSCEPQFFDSLAGGAGTH